MSPMRPLVVVVPTASYARRGRQPRLSQVRLAEIAWRAAATHLGRHPPRVNRVRLDVRPQPGDGEGQQDVVQLGVRVRLRAAPAPPYPLQIVEYKIPAEVHAGAEIDQPFGSLDERGQQVRRERVDREHVLQPVDSLSSRLLVADGRVVYDDIEPAGLV